MSDSVPPEDRTPASPPAEGPLDQRAAAEQHTAPVEAQSARAPDHVDAPRPRPAAGRLILVIAGAVLLVIGLGTLIAGLLATSSATAARDDAQTDLRAAQSDLVTAEDDLAAAEGELDAARTEADSTIGVADEVLVVGGELCDCDGRLTDLETRMREAAEAGDLETLDALAAEANTEIDTANDLLDALRSALGIGGVSASR